MSESVTDNFHCIVCGSDSSLPALGKKREDMVKCQSCGLVCRTSRQDEKEILDYYRDVDYSKFTQDWMKARKSSFLGYVSRMESFRKTNRILDVGAGHGFFLNDCKNSGWECSGVEPSTQAVAFAHEQYGLDIKESTIEAAGFPENYFDVVTLWNVLDQIPDPAKTMRETYRVLRPGGAVFIRIPNADFHVNASKAFGILSGVFPKFKGLDQTVFHLYSFNKNTIKRLLSNSDFTSIDVQGAKLCWSMRYDSPIASAKRIIAPIFEKGVCFLTFITCNNLFISPSILVSAIKK